MSDFVSGAELRTGTTSLNRFLKICDELHFDNVKHRRLKIFFTVFINKST